MRRFLRASLPVLALAAVGCATAVAPPVAAPVLVAVPGPVAADGVTATGRLGLGDAARRLLGAGPQPWTAADIDEVVVALYQGATRLVAVPVGKAHLATAIAIGNLRRNTTYSVVLTARAGDVAIDDADAAPASCTTTFTTTSAATLDVGPFKLKLRDKSTAAAAGTTGSPIHVTAGGLTPGGGAEPTEAGALACTTAPVAATLLAASPTDATLVAYKNTSSNARFVDTQDAATTLGVKFTGTPVTECLRFGPAGGEHFRAFDVYPYAPFQPGDKIGTGTFPVGNQPQYVAINPANGEVWAANYQGDSLTRLAADGTFVATYTGFGHPADMQFDANGDLWVVSGALPTSSLYRVSPTTGAKLQTVSIGSNAYGLAIDKDGDLWVACLSSKEVQQVKPNGTKTSYAVPAGYFGPLDLVADSTNRMWVSILPGSGGSGALVPISQTGTWGTALATGVNPSEVACDAADRVWVANGGDESSLPVNAGGVTRVDTTTTPPTVTQLTNLGGKYTGGIAVDSKGYIWATRKEAGSSGASSGKNVIRLDGTGAVQGYFLAGTTASKPYGITAKGGVIWTANSETDNVSGFHE